MASPAPVGVFDSGLGGISVLRALRAALPGEDFLYFGDSRHAPYGDKPLSQVRALSLDAAGVLLDRGAKAIVIACNTATSAAAALLREQHPALPIIGTEPALKPAVERHRGGRILVMATEMTLHEEKFRHLQAQFQGQAQVEAVPCPGLMEFVEQGIFQGGGCGGLSPRPSGALPLRAGGRGGAGMHPLSLPAGRHSRRGGRRPGDSRRRRWHRPPDPAAAGGPGAFEPQNCRGRGDIPQLPGRPGHPRAVRSAACALRGARPSTRSGPSVSIPREIPICVKYKEVFP